MNYEKMGVPFTERLKGIPGFFGIRLTEKPRYEILKEENSFEVRQYPQLLMATTTISSDYQDAKNEGCNRLMDYIFGHNHLQGRIVVSSPALEQNCYKIHMTSPVLEERQSAGWRISFILPKEESLFTVPEPNDDRITLLSIPEQIWAVHRYNGLPKDEIMAAKQGELEIWLSYQTEFRIVSEPRWAQYDGPLVIPFLRRNEVQIQVENFNRHLLSH